MGLAVAIVRRRALGAPHRTTVRVSSTPSKLDAAIGRIGFRPFAVPSRKALAVWKLVSESASESRRARSGQGFLGTWAVTVLFWWRWYRSITAFRVQAPDPGHGRVKAVEPPRTKNVGRLVSRPRAPGP
jgi:hypothetical protein